MGRPTLSQIREMLPFNLRECKIVLSKNNKTPSEEWEALPHAIKPKQWPNSLVLRVRNRNGGMNWQTWNVNSTIEKIESGVYRVLTLRRLIGFCPVCRKLQKINQDGTLRSHGTCVGAGRPELMEERRKPAKAKESQKPVEASGEVLQSEAEKTLF